MGTLFEIVNEFKALYDVMTDEDVSKEAVETTLECLKADLSDKASGYLAVMDQLDMEEKKCDEMMKEWKKRRDKRREAIDRMKQAMIAAINELGVKEIKAGEVVLKVQNNGGQLPLKIEGDVPEWFCKIILEPDNAKIREALDKGAELEFAHFGERTQRLVIK